MVKTRTVKDVSGSVDLCETYSDEGKKLLQIETGITYDESVIDAIAGYNEDGSPYSRYHYEEVNIPIQEWEKHEIVEELKELEK